MTDQPSNDVKPQSQLLQIGLRGIGIERFFWNETDGSAHVVFKIRVPGSNDLAYQKRIDIPNLWYLIQPMLRAAAFVELEFREGLNDRKESQFGKEDA
jgi:hypothetical protein